MADQGLFSVPALFIVFRETLEAAIVCSVLLGVLAKVNLQNLNRFVWIGVALGLIFTGLILAATLIAFKIATDRLLKEEEQSNSTNSNEDGGLSNEAEIKLKAGLTFSAGIMIAIVCWTLGDILKKQNEIEKEILQRAKEALDMNNLSPEEVTKGKSDSAEKANEPVGSQQKKESKVVNGWTIFLLSFTAVAREGVETVIFLGVGSGFDGKSIPIPLVVGFIAGSIGGVLLYRLGNKLALKWFFRISVVFLAFVGAGIFTHGVEELYHLVDFGWWGELVYNISYCCGLRKPGYQLFRAIFGYTPYPTRAEMFAYFMYHLVIILGFLVKFLLEKYNVNMGRMAKRAWRKLTKTKQEILVEEMEEKVAEEKLEEDLDDIMHRRKDKNTEEKNERSQAEINQHSQTVSL